MKRITVLGICLISLVITSAWATAPAFAAEEENDANWTVDGVPLTAREKVPFTLEGTTPTEIILPDSNIAIVCPSFLGKGKLKGGELGTSAGSKLKVGGECNVVETGKAKPAIKFEHWKIKVKITVVKSIKPHLDGIWFIPNTWTLWFEVHIEIKVDPIPEVEPLYVGEGVIDAQLGEEDPSLVQFPTTPLETSTLTLNGHPAIFATTARLTLTNGGTLGIGKPVTKEEEKGKKA